MLIEPRDRMFGDPTAMGVALGVYFDILSYLCVPSDVLGLYEAMERARRAEWR